MLKSLLTRFKNDERGVTAIEYGVIGVALAVGLVIIFGNTDGTGSGFMGTLMAAFDSIAEAMGVGQE
ncbi:hypothetical protein JCM19241_2835 [Vibrio ishigakensis]|uniref:Flp pilus assembly protein n=1 Tax=Vibrio ishigakensis TaxID=1481914 RepID=A0A0B8Q1Q6_9VIBR|nr:hypothetical protein JCM19241_2835 [Vibrio ishigakensis]